MTTRREFLKKITVIPVAGMLPASVVCSGDQGRTNGAKANLDRLRRLCLNRLLDQYEQACFARAARRLDHELAILDRIGRADDFLAVVELVAFAREESIPLRLTGSGCSSIIPYLLGFSDVDPIRHQLFFERLGDPDGRWVPAFYIQVDRKHLERILSMVYEYNGDVRDGERAAIYVGTLDWNPLLVAEWLQREHGCTVDLGNIPLDDDQAFRLIRSGDTEEIDVFDSDGLRYLLPRFRPASVEVLAGTNTLYMLAIEREDLMERYLQPAGEAQFPGSDNPDILEALAETRGLILYQEQIMMLLDRIGGIRPADGFDFIKSVSRRKAATVAEYRRKFLRIAVGNNADKETAEGLFDQITEAAGFFVCKANCVAEAIRTYQAAYLKAHYRPELDKVLEEYQARN